MTRSNKLPVVFYAVLAAGLLTLAAIADHHIDVEYAEQMPLAKDSLLLDITRAGDTLVTVGERGHVLTSTDGKTWVQAEHVPTRSTLTTVFSVGKRIWAGGHDAVIITSSNKGKTWTQEFFDPDRQQAVMDIHFFDENNGIAIGSYGLYMSTGDGGKTWDEQVVDPEIDYHLNSILDLGEGRLLIAGEAGYSYRSFDNGETWEALDLPYEGSMWGALRASDECVLFYGLRGHVLESCDSGDSWTELETGSVSSIPGAAEQDGVVLLAANSGVVMTRQDSGPFEIHHHSSGVDFAAALPLGDGDFLLVGEEGIHRFPEATGEGESDD
jgi:photosystem II stability/assembly factor-like uncharacterized protein